MTIPTTKHILIVDDEESMRLLLCHILESIPAVELALADGSVAALKLAAERRFDLILLDLLMPGMDGVEVLNRLRGSTLNKATPVIIVSVMSDQATRIVCKSLGANDYVVKPIDRGAILAAVNCQLGAAEG